jgi:hypothetical protein
MVVRAIQEGVIIDMYVKKFKKKCGVRGCKNISDVFIISRRREMGNTVAMCRQCMVDALKATDGYVEEVKVKKAPTQLFPHPEIKPTTLSPVADEESQPTEVIEEATEISDKSATEDTVAKDFFDAIEKTNTAKPKSKVASTTPNKTKKSSTKKK